MKKLIFSLFLLTLSLITPHIAQAQDTSASASTNLTKTTQGIKKILKKYVDSEKIKGVINQLSSRKRGFIGQVERVTAESLTVVNNKGTQIIAINDQVELLKQGRVVSIDEIAIDDWLVVMGIIDENDLFSPKRILVSSSSLRPKNHLVALGTIIAQSPQELTLLSRQKEEIKFNLTKKTNFQDHDGQTATKNDFIKDLQVLVVGFKDETGQTATTIRTLVSLDALQDE